ncbi:hypothetical protein PFISCL1PPCAC_1437, partial [Pristionchus fissidentatus]
VCSRMAKKRHQSSQKSTWVPTVGNGGIQKKTPRKGQQQSAPSYVFRAHQPLPMTPNAIPRFPVFPIPVTMNPSRPPPPPMPIPPHRLGPPPHPTQFPPLPPPFPSLPPPHSHFTQPSPADPSHQSMHMRVMLGGFVPPNGRAGVGMNGVAGVGQSRPPLPPPLAPIGLVTTPIVAGRRKTPIKQQTTVKKSKSGSEVTTKKAQLKMARQLADTNKKKTVVSTPIVKEEPGAPKFNIFMNIAQRYRTTASSPDTIDIVDDEEEEDQIEEIPREEQTETADADMTIVDNMSICTVDEVGEETIDVIENEEGEGGERERREEGREIEEDEEIVCLGEHKSTHVMSEVILLDDDVVELKETDVVHESPKKERTKRASTSVMEQSIVVMSLKDEKEKSKATVSSTSVQLPDFIPLVDGKDKKKTATPKPSAAARRVQPATPVVQQKNERDLQQLQPILPSHSSFPWIGAPISTPIMMLTRQKGKKERRKEKGRKRADMRAMEVVASPATLARAVSASTCTLNPLAFATPSKIPLPNTAPPPTPLAHLFRFPPGSRPSSHLPSTSAMGMIQSRGLATSSKQSQPANINGIGMPTPSSAALVGGGGATTLAALLNDETEGVVRDSLTASGCYRRVWEEKWMSPGDDRVSNGDVKVDPSAAPFRICSYNVLCQKTIGATDYLYKHARFQPHVLEWAHRWPLIQRELSELNADVFGLQEIQDVHFEQFYEPFLKSLGYVCLFQKKSETQHADGLGVFVRANRFKITAMNSVDFLVRGDKLLDRGNVAQLLRLECLQTGASLIVSNTHILFNEKRGDVKLAQIALLMANIHAMRTGDEPVICLGDWNLEPASDLYNYITNGSLDASTFIPRYGSGQLREGRNFNVPPMREMPMDTHLKTKMSRDGVLYENEGALLQSLRSSHPSMFSHQIPLTSTYAPYRDRRVSTYHKDIANPDFIFYTTAGRGEQEASRLRLIRRLSMPPEASIRQHLEPWPNSYVPSDHIPLMAEFYLSK